MTTTMPRVEVQAPALSAYPFGVLSVATPVEPADAHKYAGVWWTSKAVGAVGTTYSPCDVDAPSPINALDPNVVCTTGESKIVFTLYAYNDGSVGGGSLDEKFARASELLIAGEQRAIEEALWAALALHDTAAGTAASPLEALALLEQEATGVYAGTPTMHVSRTNATLCHDVLAPQGSKLKTLLGSDVVAGGGYGSNAVIYATGPLVMTRGPILNLGQHYDRATNDISAVVERTYSIGWDGSALSAAIS